MPAAWTGTIAQLKTLNQTKSLVPEIISRFERSFFKTTESEIGSWEESIPALLEVLTDEKYDQIQVIIELAMPVGAERADIVLIGGSRENPKAIVLELKQWSHIAFLEDTLEVDVPMSGIHQHPSVQALNYAGKLHFFNSRAHKYSIHAFCFLHNARSKDGIEISSGKALKLTEAAPIITYDDRERMGSLVSDFLLPCSINTNEAALFSDAPYKQSNHLFSFLRDNAKEIATGAALALANTGMGLTTEQNNVVNDVLRSIHNGETHDFIVQGGPGSGKTLLAVSLLLRAAESNISCILAIRNNRLQAILRQIFDQVYPGASGMMMFFEPRQGQGIANFEGKIDILICDEAQRMESRIMSNVLSKSKVSAIFLDETQRLNPPEEGTIKNFVNASLSTGRLHSIRYLTASIRFPTKYNSWVEALLADPQKEISLQEHKRALDDQYLLETMDDFEIFLSKLAKLASDESRVAMVASFTESPGNRNSINSPENIRIGHPLTSGFDFYKSSKQNISWLMSTADYRKYWIGGLSNKLTRVSSIYGAQGFESDYVGVIWGRDLLLRNGSWVLGDPSVCFDTIDRLITGRYPNHRWNDEALPLLLNRYRIFLTRGIKGTLIFCEDLETRSYLQKIIKN